MYWTLIILGLILGSFILKKNGYDCYFPTFSMPTRRSIIEGYYNFHSGKTRASFNNLCLTRDPYYTSSDLYYWWKYQPFYWQKKYQHCSKYGCGGSHDKSSCPERTALKPLDCSDIKYTPYASRGYGAKNKLFYQNRAEFCYRNPNHINCPNSFSGQCPRPDQTFSTVDE